MFGTSSSRLRPPGSCFIKHATTNSRVPFLRNEWVSAGNNRKRRLLFPDGGKSSSVVVQQCHLGEELLAQRFEMFRLSRGFATGSGSNRGGGRFAKKEGFNLDGKTRTARNGPDGSVKVGRRPLPMSIFRKGREEATRAAGGSSSTSAGNMNKNENEYLGLTGKVGAGATAALPEVTRTLDQVPSKATGAGNRRTTRLHSSFFQQSSNSRNSDSSGSEAASSRNNNGSNPAFHLHEDPHPAVQLHQEKVRQSRMTLPLSNSRPHSVYSPFGDENTNFGLERPAQGSSSSSTEQGNQPKDGPDSFSSPGSAANPGFSGTVDNHTNVISNRGLAAANLALEVIEEDVTKSKEQDEASKLFDKRAELFRTDNLDVIPTTLESERAKQDRLIGYRVFRAMAPYIAVHYGTVVVIHIPGEVLESDNAEAVMHDIVLLKTLGIKVVLVAGCRPQIRRKLEQVGKKSLFVQGNRVCDTETLYHCQSVAGHVRLYIESLLTRGLMNSPTGIGSVTVTSGNFVRAIAFGVRGGIDFLHTGIVKKVNEKRINELLDHGDVVVLGHLGVSSSGTIYHCRSEDVAVQAAIDIKATKLVFLHNGEMLVDMRKRGGAIVHNLPINVARSFGMRLAEELGESGHERVRHTESDPKEQWKLQFLDYLQGAIRSVEGGVHRAHLVSRHIHGAIISELCTRDGIGLLISQDLYDGVRPASTHDVPALKSLIAPLERNKILVTRPPKQIEKEIDQFIVFEREGMILACCRLDFFKDPRYGEGAVEMSCVAVSSALHGEGIGNALLSYCLRRAFAKGIKSLFVLTTRTQGWFIDRGFKEVGPENLPPAKLKAYDYSRNSKVFFKHIEDERAIDEEEILWFRKNTTTKPPAKS